VLILRIQIEIQSEKRQEFLHAMKLFREMSGSGESSQPILTSSLADDNCLFLWMECKTEDQLKGYLQSSPYQFFKGAVAVLGRLVDSRVLRATDNSEFGVSQYNV